MTDKVVSKNPATGEILREIPATNPTELPRIFERARAAQAKWAALSPRKRAAHLLHLREVLVRHADTLIDTLSTENGKPRFEAMANELVPSAELISYFARKGPSMLRDRRIGLRLMKHQSSTLNFWPLGVVAVISPWNYPFLLPWGEIVMALIAGNAVVFKPSEVTPLVGLKIQELIDESDLPPDIVQTVVGDGSLGAALIQQKPDKIFFTGSVATGKRIAAAAAEHLIPTCLELGGKDAMVVLPDADLDFATSAALWGGFSNSGQVCASVERVLVHEKQAQDFVARLKEKLGKLRQGGDLSQADLGYITAEKQKAVYEEQLRQAKTRGASFATGGEFSSDGRALLPTVVSGTGIEDLDLYNDETFGPVVAVATYKTIAEAIEKANRSRYALLASVITRDIGLGRRVAHQLIAGTVTINEVTYTAALPETPWGGLKDSGIGRKHSELGLMEFVNVRHIHGPRFRFLTFKSLWWFPYTPFQYAAFREFFNLYKRSWVEKAKALPMVLWNLVQMLKNEKRL